MHNPTVRRDLNGQLLPGSKLTLGVPNYLARDLCKLRQRFHDFFTNERLEKVLAELFDMAQNAPPREKLAAIALLLERLFGKVKDTVELEVKQRPLLDASDYSDRQIADLLQILDNPEKLPAVEDKRPEPMIWDSIPVNLDVVADNPRGDQQVEQAEDPLDL